MRPIDADALKLYIDKEVEEDKVLDSWAFFFKIYLDDAPTIDIVRCKECKHNYNKTLNYGKMYPRCDFTDWKLSENDYCSRGEREGE